MNLYIMAPRQLIETARKMDTSFNDNIRVVSTWYKRWGAGEDHPGDLGNNEREIKSADLALMFTKDDYGLELWCELGRLIERKVPIYWVDLSVRDKWGQSDSKLPLSIYSPLIQRFNREVEAVNYINNLAKNG
jgi:hypothetical protein